MSVSDTVSDTGSVSLGSRIAEKVAAGFCLTTQCPCSRQSLCRPLVNVDKQGGVVTVTVSPTAKFTTAADTDFLGRQALEAAKIAVGETVILMAPPLHSY